MAIGRAEPWRERQPRVREIFGDDAETQRRVAAVLELMERAWHDNYGEITPPDDVIEDVLLCSRGKLGDLIDAAQLAVVDWHDLRLQADDLRTR